MLRAALPHGTPQGEEPDGPVLWSWTPFGDDAAVRRPLRIALHIAVGSGLLALGISEFLQSLDPECTTRACSRAQARGPILALFGLLVIVFPWLGLRWRTYFTARFELTPTHFLRHEMGKTTRFALSDGRVVIRYNIAWFEPVSGFRKRMTSLMPRRVSAQLFEAVRQARALSSAQEPHS